MIGWLRLVLLRTEAMNVLRNEYEIPHELMSGRWAAPLTNVTKVTRRFNGNAYDVASAYAALMHAEMRNGKVEENYALARAPMTATRLLPSLKIPEVFERQWTAALNAGGQNG